MNHLRLSVLAAVATLTGIALPAHAQSSVSLSGLVDVFAASTRLAGAPGRVTELGSGGLTTSWIGFRGTEDLGGGLKATFALTSFMRADSGVYGRFNGDPSLSRDANVGLTGNFGTVRLGRGTAPNFLPTIFANPFGDSFTYSPLVLHANVNSAGWGYRTSPSDTGWSNQVAYTTPVFFDGLTATLQYQFGEQAKDTGNNDKKNVGLNVLYISGPWTAVAFFERDQISNPVAPGLLTTPVAGVAVPETKRDWMVGGAYNADFAKFFLTYGGAKTEIAVSDAKTTSLGVNIPFAGGSILGAVARTKVEGTFEGTRTTGTIGYDYFLSKRTDLYAIAMRDRVTDRTSGNSVGVGMRHRF
jgi:predicted porin